MFELSESDANLLERFACRGDAKAFLLLYHRHQKHVKAAALRVLTYDEASADDVVQMVFVRLSTHPPDIETLRDLRSWLMRCATNHALNIRRDRTRQATREMEFAHAEIDRVEWRNRLQNLVPRLLENLTPTEASSLLARYIEGLEFEEISARFGWPSPESARKRIARTISKLRADTPLLALCGTLLATAAGAADSIRQLFASAPRARFLKTLPIAASIVLLAWLYSGIATRPAVSNPGAPGLVLAASGPAKLEKSAQSLTQTDSFIVDRSSHADRNDITSTGLATPSTIESASKLIAHWPMDGYAGNRTLDRVSGLRAESRHARDAMLVGGFNGRGALRFTGNSGLLVREADFLNRAADGGSFTISLWHRNDGLASASSFYGVSESHYDRRGIQAHIPWKDGRVYWDTSGKERIELDPADHFQGWDWYDGTWHHYAFVKNGDFHSIWIDGRQVASALAGPLPQDFTAFWIGSREGEGSAPSTSSAIDDLAVLGIAARPDQIAILARGEAVETALADLDADDDGLPDSYEIHHGFDPFSAADSTADPDGDGLDNLTEFQLMTDPKRPDSDGDGLPDGAEVTASNPPCEPLIRDTDQDGLDDGTESGSPNAVHGHRSHPLEFDTDGDGFSDGVEVAFGCDPTDPVSKPFESSGPVLAAYWDFDAPDAPWKDLVSGVVALPSPTCSLLKGPKGGAVRFRGGTGLRVAAPQFHALAGAMNTMVISFWSKRWKPSRGTSVFVESPSNRGTPGIRIHSPWKDGSVIFDTPRNPAFRGSSRAWVAPHAVGIDAGDAADDWHHFVFSIHDLNKEIWIDGKRVYQGESGPLPRDLSDLWIGGPPGLPGISGTIDEFAIFISPLGEDSIQRLHQGAKPTEIAAHHSISSN